MAQQSEESIENVWIARQPIMDRSQSLVGYELLYRSPESTQEAIYKSDLVATARVLIDTLHSIGIKKILGNLKGFLNINDQVINAGLMSLISPEHFVLEIVRNTDFTEEFKNSLSKLKSQGYTLILDNFQFSSRQMFVLDEVIALIDFVKIDLSQVNLNTLPKQVEELHEKGVQIIARGVENTNQFQACESMGFELFQGFFFARPELIRGKRLDPRASGVLELVRLLYSDADINNLVNSFEQYPEISLNLLRFVNSASFSSRAKIKNIQHALTMVGRNVLRQWLTMMVYSRPGVPASNSPLLISATQRAKTMEFLCEHISEESVDSHEAFLCGIVSQMDAIFQVPMKDILDELQLDDEIQDAILEQEGPLGKLLQLAVFAQKSEDFDSHEMMLGDLGLSPSNLGFAVLQSYAWVSDHF